MTDAGAPESKPVRLIEMIQIANDEAEHIEGIEAARVASGDGPNLERVRRAEIMRATARFLLKIEERYDEVKPILVRQKRTRTR
jgi:hypothetical protein